MCDVNIKILRAAEMKDKGAEKRNKRNKWMESVTYEYPVSDHQSQNRIYSRNYQIEPQQKKRKTKKKTLVNNSMFCYSKEEKNYPIKVTIRFIVRIHVPHNHCASNIYMIWVKSI